MNIAGFLTACFNNPKRNSLITGRKDKTNNLKIDVIMNNTAKVRKDDDFNFSDNEGNLRRGDKGGEKLYDKENNNKNEKVRVAKLDKYHGKKEKLKP